MANIRCMGLWCSIGLQWVKYENKNFNWAPLVYVHWCGWIMGGVGIQSPKPWEYWSKISFNQIVYVQTCGF